MIRSTLFKSLAPALRDSLSDAEVSALGLWLLASSGIYPTRGISIYAKDERGTAAIEGAVGARYIYPEDVAPDVALAGGSINAAYRLPPAGNLALAASLSGIEEFMYAVAMSNQDREAVDVAAAEQAVVQVTNTPAQPQEWPRNRPQTPDVAEGWQQLDRLVRGQPIPQWLNEQLVAETAEPQRRRVFEQRALEQDPDHLRDLSQREVRERERLARTTRGIPNRR